VAAPHRTRLDPDRRREQILAAAMDLFATSGAAGTSVDAVAERAGVTRGLVHHYFGNRRELFLAVLERSLAIPDGIALVPPGPGGPIEEVLGRAVEQWMDMVEEAGGMWRGVAGSLAEGDPDVERIYLAARDDLVERIIAGLPFPADLDRDALRGALRSYAAFARVATDEWLVRGTLDRDRTRTLLTATLVALARDVVPQMGPPRR
jgi:AcrR family transcriptional regulator